MTLAKSFCSWPLAVLVLVGAGGCSGIHTLTRGEARTLSLPDLLAEVAEKKEAFRLPEGGLIVRVPPGSRVPFKLALATPFATFEPGDNHLRFDREVYFHVRGRSMALSPDGERWADVTDWKAMKRLFGAGQGYFSLGAGITREDGAVIQATLGFAPPR